MIKAIIFDVGGVLLRTEDRRPRQQIEARLRLAAGQAEHIVFNSEMGQKAQHGEITTAQLWAWVQEFLRLDDREIAQFRQEFWAGDVMDYALVDFVRTLRPRYQTAIISNAMDNLKAMLGDEYPIADAFDLIVGSAYEKIMKPAPEIFQRTLERLGRQPSEAVFIDDFMHNVVGARALGMHAVHFQPGIDLLAEFKTLGVV